MLVDFEIVSVPTADTPGTTVVLNFDRKRYLLGSIAEGTQRSCIEAGLGRLNKIGALFITGRTEWRNIGGLMGLVLTVADSAVTAQASRRQTIEEKTRRIKAMLAVATKAKEVKRLEEQLAKNAEETKENGKQKKLEIFGAKNLMHAIGTCRRFIFRKGMPLYPFEVAIEPSRSEENEITPTWGDENIRVWAMSITPEEKEKDVKMMSPRSVSGRKRSIDEVNGTAENDNRASESDAAEHLERDDTLRDGVVADMFRSSWSLDQLTEQPLSQVKLPASLFVRNTETRRLDPYKGPLPGQPHFVDIKVWCRKPWPGALIRSLPKTQPSQEAASYIALSHRQRGNYDVAKLQQYNIKGAMRGEMTRTGKVENEKGEVITYDMVTGPTTPGQGLAVVELPSRDYVQPLISRPEWSVPDVVAGLTAIVWILGPDVISDPALRSFMEHMENVEHIISSPERCTNELSIDSAALSAARLNKVDPDRFKIPLFDNTNPVSGDEPLIPAAGEHLISHSRLAKRGLKIICHPKKTIQTNSIRPSLDPKSHEGGLVSEAVRRRAVEAQEALRADQSSIETWKQSIPCPDAEIITLGTGSASPSKYRNVSATLLRVPGVGSYLFDAGEGTIGQLRRVFTSAELIEVFKDLRMIWISHLHADHHLGTASVIKEWYNVVHPGETDEAGLSLSSITADTLTAKHLASNRRLVIVSDTGMLNWLAEYSEAEDFGYHHLLPLYISDGRYPTFDSKLYWHPGSVSQSDDDKSFVISPNLYPSLFGLSDIQAVHVNHCQGAKAVAVTFPNGFKASYSGDCRPSKPFSEIGKGSTVLIHEATFEDELRGDAKAKSHSTTTEALRIGAMMGAKAVVLTHFSQRYQKIPVMDQLGSSSDVDDDGEEERSLGELGPAGYDAPLNMDEDDIMKDAMMDIGMDLDVKAAVKQGQAKSNKDGSLNSDSATTPAQPSKGGVAKVNVGAKDMKVCVAFDYMRIKVGDIAKMEKFTPALVQLFEEKEKEDKEA